MNIMNVMLTYNLFYLSLMGSFYSFDYFNRDKIYNFFYYHVMMISEILIIMYVYVRRKL